MKKAYIIKGLALANFILLLSAFILYRCDFFDRSTPKPDNTSISIRFEQLAVKPGDDSIPPKKDSLEQLRFASSKSIVITDRMKFWNDSLKARQSAPKLTPALKAHFDSLKHKPEAPAKKSTREE